MSANEDLAPIVVVVKNGRRWDAFAPIPLTPRSTWLLSVLQGYGGINESVADGHYHFNALPIESEENSFRCTLTPID